MLSTTLDGLLSWRDIRTCPLPFRGSIHQTGWHFFCLPALPRSVPHDASSAIVPLRNRVHHRVRCASASVGSTVNQFSGRWICTGKDGPRERRRALQELAVSGLRHARL